MKYAFTTTMAVFVCLTVTMAQTSGKPAVNALSFEIGKTGAIYNLNYDRKRSATNFGFRFGAGSNFGKYLKAITVGGGGYTLIEKAKRFFELGLDVQYLIVEEFSDDQRGVSLIYPGYSIKTLYPGLNVGYRAYGEATLFRIGFSPGLIERKIIPGGYVSYGLTF